MIDLLPKISCNNIEVTDSNEELKIHIWIELPEKNIINWRKNVKDTKTNEEFESSKSEPKKVLNSWKLTCKNKLD